MSQNWWSALRHHPLWMAQDATPPVAVRAPHLLQKLSSAGTAWPRLRQVRGRPTPHLPQKLLPSGTSTLQLGHCKGPYLMFGHYNHLSIPQGRSCRRGAHPVGRRLTVDSWGQCLLSSCLSGWHVIRPRLLLAQGRQPAALQQLCQLLKVTDAFGLPWRRKYCRVGPGNFTPSLSQIRT